MMFELRKWKITKFTIWIVVETLQMEIGVSFYEENINRYLSIPKLENKNLHSPFFLVTRRHCLIKILGCEESMHIFIGYLLKTSQVLKRLIFRYRFSNVGPTTPFWKSVLFVINIGYFPSGILKNYIYTLAPLQITQR